MRCVASLKCLFLVFLLRAMVPAKAEPSDKKKTLAGEIIDFKRKLTVSKLYSSLVPPSDGTKQVLTVTKYFSFEDEFVIDPEKQVVSFTITDCDTWKDSRLEWEKDSSHVEDMLVPQYSIWKPSSVYSAQRKRMFLYPSYLEYNGHVVACDAFFVSLSCSFDMRDFPNDSHDCVFKTRSHNHGINELEYEATFSGVEPSSEWKIFAVEHVTTELYSNQGNFSTVVVTLRFQRRSHLYGSRVYLPLWSIVICSMIALFCPESSRVTISSLTLLTAFLQHCSLLNLVRGSTSTPRIVFFSSVLVMTTFCILTLAAFRTQVGNASSSHQGPLAQFSNKFSWTEKYCFLPLCLLLAFILFFL